MSSLRPLSHIQADIADTARRLAELETERTRTRTARRAGIVADFDAGMARADIAAKWEVDYAYVASVLHQAARTERTRRRKGLSPTQRVHYDKLVRLGIAGTLAGSIARAIAPPVAPTIAPPVAP